MKKIFKKLIIFLCIILLPGCSEKTNYIASSMDGRDVYTIDDVSYIESEEVTNLVKIDVKNEGIMIVELYPNIAPITVENFKNLVSEYFYDGLIFHRVVKDFVIQAGDPSGSAKEGSAKTIKGEFSKNGVENILSHVRGVISMARLGAQEETEETMNSASSQFFIVHKDATYLDGSYAGFGMLIHGFDVLDSIASASTNENEKPINDRVINSIRFVVEM